MAGWTGLDMRLGRTPSRLRHLEKKVETIAKVQKADYEENRKQHKQIIEMLTERLGIQDR